MWRGLRISSGGTADKRGNKRAEMRAAAERRWKEERRLADRNWGRGTGKRDASVGVRW